MSTKTTSQEESKNDKLLYYWQVVRFTLIHLVCLAAIWTGVSIEAVAICIGLYAIRMFGVTGGYHRYFSHRTYKMGRVMQFLMAFLAQSSAQKGVLWWASHHRHHHQHSDEEEDVHSPVQDGFWHSHVGWIFDPKWAEPLDDKVKDLLKYPELRFLERFHLLPAVLLGVATFFLGEALGIGGWQALVVGFMWSTVLCWHGTFTINSLSHVIGSRRYDTSDESRNNFFLALITFGEGWHNNHHHYQASVNQGFYWWEIDLTYYTLKALSFVGLVSDLRTPPEHVIKDEPHPKVVARRERQAEQEKKEAADKEKSAAEAA